VKKVTGTDVELTANQKKAMEALELVLASPIHPQLDEVRREC
jgi:hypothetical protein